jgi:hypothetical protein
LRAQKVDGFLRSKGFALYDVSDVERSPGLFKTNGAGQFDALYVRLASPKAPVSMRKAEFCVKPSAFALGAAQEATSTPLATTAATLTTLATTPTATAAPSESSAVDALTAENARLAEKVRELTVRLEGCGSGAHLRSGALPHGINDGR